MVLASDKWCNSDRLSDHTEIDGYVASIYIYLPEVGEILLQTPTLTSKSPCQHLADTSPVESTSYNCNCGSVLSLLTTRGGAYALDDRYQQCHKDVETPCVEWHLTGACDGWPVVLWAHDMHTMWSDALCHVCSSICLLFRT